MFGPIHSRRLGISLGINLMPNDGKVCSFDCLYCEAGFNAQGPGRDGIPSREGVKRQLKKKLEAMQAEGQGLDVITFSGNGEPTLHPHFAEVVHDVLLLREDEMGQKHQYRINLNDANLINSPLYYLQQNDIVYVEPNTVKAKNSDIGSSTTIWFSFISIATSVASLLVNILR